MFFKNWSKVESNRSINAHPPKRMLTFPCKSVSKWLVLLAAPLAVVVTLYSDETTSSWCHAFVPLRPSEMSSITNIVIVSRDVSLKRLIFFFSINLIKGIELGNKVPFGSNWSFERIINIRANNFNGKWSRFLYIKADRLLINVIRRIFNK